MKELKILLLNLPSPPNQDVHRDAAGGFGVAFPRPGNDYGESMQKGLHPFLPYAASILSEEGYEFKVLDCQRLKLNRRETLRFVMKEDPDIIFSLIGLPSMQKELELLNEIKNAVQNVWIVGVGTVCRTLPDEILLKGGVDIILRNHYPYVSNMIDLIQALQGSKGLKSIRGISYAQGENVVHTTETSELESRALPKPLYDPIDLDGYQSFIDLTGEKYQYVSVLGSVGCPYPCIYCPYPVGFGRNTVYRPPKDIVDEIEYLHNVRGIRGFLLRTQSFSLNLKHAEEILDEIIRRKLEIAWFCEARVDEITKKLLEKMKKFGCKRVHYGVETGDPRIIKMAKPGVTLETIRKAFKITKEVGLWANAHMILGWPDETLESIENTRKFILELNPDGVNWNFLTPYPGTKIREIAQKHSLILSNNWSNYTSYTIVMRTKNLTADQLDKAVKHMIRNLNRQRMPKMLLQQFRLHNPKQVRRLLNEVKCLFS